MLGLPLCCPRELNKLNISEPTHHVEDVEANALTRKVRGQKL
jgi:hypothetical protein